MGLMKKIAGHCKTVEVAGEKVKLRLPSHTEKSFILSLARSVEGESGEEAIHRSMRLAPLCLEYTVVNEDEMSEEEWSKVVTAADECPDDFPGLPDLVKECMTLCGLKITAVSRDAIDELTQEVAEEMKAQTGPAPEIVDPPPDPEAEKEPAGAKVCDHVAEEAENLGNDPSK